MRIFPQVKTGLQVMVIKIGLAEHLFMFVDLPLHIAADLREFQPDFRKPLFRVLAGCLGIIVHTVWNIDPLKIQGR